jgi:hypothetical protein
MGDLSELFVEARGAADAVAHEVSFSAAERLRDAIDAIERAVHDGEPRPTFDPLAWLRTASSVLWAILEVTPSVLAELRNRYPDDPRLHALPPRTTEDAEDAEVARRSLAEINRNPGSVVSGAELEKRLDGLAELSFAERVASDTRKVGNYAEFLKSVAPSAPTQEQIEAEALSRQQQQFAEAVAALKRG